MRVTLVSIVALVAGTISLAACLPQQRPDANFLIKGCDDAPLEVARHNACLYFDATDSHVFSGNPKYEWSATATYVGAGSATVTSNLADFATSAGTGAITPKRVWFATQLHAQTTITVKLLVKDSLGLSRASTQQLVLTNSSPTMATGDVFLRARASDVLLNPFVVVHLPILDDDGDYQAIDVTQLYPRTDVPGNKLQVVRCSDVPTRLQSNPQSPPVLSYPDPSDGDPNALCATITPLDDTTTSSVNESVCDGVTNCLAFPLFDKDPRDFVLRVKVREEGVEPPESTPGTNCVPRVDGNGVPIEVVGCVTVRVGDVLWTANAASADAGQITRVASGWRRSRPGGVVVRNGQGAAENPGGDVVVAGTLEFCALEDFCPGALVEYAPDMSVGAISGIGEIADIRYTDVGPSLGSPIPGWWVSAISVDSNGNPGALSGGPVIPVGEPYDVFIPQGILGTNNAFDVSSLPSSFFTYVTGMNEADGTLEAPETLAPASDGALWIATGSYCAHYDSGASTCNLSNTGLPARLVRGLRRLPPTTLGAAPADIASLTNLEPLPNQLPPGFGLPVVTIAADAAGGLYALTADLNNYDSKLYHFDSTGTVDRTPRDFPSSYIDGIAFFHDAQTNADRVWISDAVTASMSLIPDAVAGATPIRVPANFTLPEAFSVDSVGQLWVDDHLNDFTRRVVAIAADASGALELDPFSSTGRGIALGSENESGAWHGDGLDVVRQPVGDPNEFPARAEGPIGSTLAGVDPTDGAAYGFSSIVSSGTSLFRVATDGTFDALLDSSPSQLGAPSCATVEPGVPPQVVGTAATPSLLWLCLPEASGTGMRLAAIDLGRLRRAVRDGVPAVTHLDPCLPSDPDDLICEYAEVAATDPVSHLGFAPLGLGFSYGDFGLWVRAHTSTGDDALYVIVDPRYFGEDAPPFVVAGLDLGANVVSPFANEPFAPGFDPNFSSSSSIGGVWVLRNDDSLARYIIITSNAAATIVAVPSLAIPRPASAPPGVHATAIANEFLSDAVWRTFGDSGSQTAFVDRSYIDVVNDTVLTCGTATVPTFAQSIAVESFNRTDLGFFGRAWLSDDSDNLVRVFAPYTPVWAAGHCGEPIKVEYVHVPDTIGTSIVTPGGRSLIAGGS